MTILDQPPSSSETLPREIFGYEVLDFIGEGAGSRIYAVSDPSTRQLYALKHVVRTTDRHVRFIEQLENEYEVCKKLNHPNLRKSFEMKENKTFLRKVTEAILLMELFDGLPLEMRMPGSMVDLTDCFLQTARGLESMHHSGFVHCDLKPNNILIGPTGEVKVIDFGQACPMGTIKKRIQGTPDYIAPEQVKCDPVSLRTDIFNFGATFYWALCGRKLPTLFTLKKSENSFLVDNQMVTPHEINPMVPESLSNFVMECVRTNPMKRPENMGEVIHRLDTIQFGLKKSAALHA